MQVYRAVVTDAATIIHVHPSGQRHRCVHSASRCLLSVGWCWWPWSESRPVTAQQRRESSSSPFVFNHFCLFGGSFQSSSSYLSLFVKVTLSLYFFTVCLHLPEQLPGHLLGLLRPLKRRPACYVRGSRACLGQNQVL